MLFPPSRPSSGGALHARRLNCVGFCNNRKRKANLSMDFAARAAQPILLRKKQHVARFDLRSPAGVLAERGDRWQRRNFLAVLDDERVVAERVADGGRVATRIRGSAGKHL